MSFNEAMTDLSESDLRDGNSNKPDTSIKKEYDFIYICLNDNDKCTPGWQSYNRNWELGKQCLDVMCGKYKLKGALVGRENCEFSNLCSGIVKVHPFLDYHSFQKELQKAYLESYSEYGQNLFDRYVEYADHWLEDQDYKDPDTGQIFRREVLDAELVKIEKPAGFGALAIIVSPPPVTAPATRAYFISAPSP